MTNFFWMIRSCVTFDRFGKKDTARDNSGDRSALQRSRSGIQVLMYIERPKLYSAVIQCNGIYHQQSDAIRFFETFLQPSFPTPLEEKKIGIIKSRLQH